MYRPIRNGKKSKKNERPRKNVEKQYDPICCEIETDGEYRPSPPWKNSRKMAAKSKHAKFVTDNAYIDAVSPIFSNERWISIPSRSPDFVPAIVRTKGTRERKENVKKKKTRTENKRKKRKREKESFCSKYKWNTRCVFESLVVFERTFTRIPCNRCVALEISGEWRSSYRKTIRMGFSSDGWGYFTMDEAKTCPSFGHHFIITPPSITIKILDTLYIEYTRFSDIWRIDPS